MEFPFQLFLGKHLGQIAGNVDAAFLKFEQFDVQGVFSSAKNDAEWFGFVGRLLMFLEPR